MRKNSVLFPIANFSISLLGFIQQYLFSRPEEIFQLLKEKMLWKEGCPTHFWNSFSSLVELSRNPMKWLFPVILYTFILYQVRILTKLHRKSLVLDWSNPVTSPFCKKISLCLCWSKTSSSTTLKNFV